MSENDRAENLASRILIQLDAAICVKLKELKGDLEELRVHFKKLKGRDRIAGCRTWAEFCENKLHRTDRAVRKMLREQSAETQQSRAEQSSAVPETKELSNSQSAAPEEEVKAAMKRKTPNETSPLSEADEARIAKNQAMSKTIGYLILFDGKDLRRKLAEFWHELRNDLWDKIAPTGAKKPAATVPLESSPEKSEMEVTV